MASEDAAITDGLEPSPDMEPHTLLRSLAARLEAMLDDPNLTRLRERDPTHPAVKRFVALHELRRESSDLRHLLPGQSDAVIEALREWIDAWGWGPTDSLSDFWAFIPDITTRRKTISRLTDARNFEDVLTELFCWGWLSSRGLDVERVEVDGVSDLVIGLGEDHEIRAEVKRIHNGTPPSVVERVIQKANSQIKKSAPPGGGIAFLSLGLPTQRALANGGIPPAAHLYVDAAEAAIWNQNTSVGLVVVTWDEFLSEDRTDAAGVKVFVHRRSVVREHPSPVVRPSIDHKLIDVRLGIEIGMRYGEGTGSQTPEGLLQLLRETSTKEALDPTTPAVVAPQFAAVPSGRATAERSFRQCDASVVHRVGDGRGKSAVATKRVRKAAADYTLVLHADWNTAADAWLIDSGYRLYDKPEALDLLTSDPNLAFCEVLLRYGFRFAVGFERAWWLPDARLRAASGSPLPPSPTYLSAALGIPPGSAGDVSHALMSPTPNGEWNVADLFWIDIEKCKAAAITASRTSVG